VVLRLLRQQWIADTVAALLSRGFLSRIAPGSFTINMALSRQFRIRERKTLEFRGEAFNLLNRLNLGNLNATLNSPIFGTVTTAADPRIMQFALKFLF